MPPRPPGPRVSVVLFLLSESIDGGIKGKKICIDMGFQGRGGWGVGGQLEILKPCCRWPLTGASSRPAMRAQIHPGTKPTDKPCP